MIYFQARGNFQIPEENLFHQRAGLRRPLEKGLHQGVRVPLPPGTAENAQNFHSHLLEVIKYNMDNPGELSRRDDF
jgi:hypothetical protein